MLSFPLEGTSIAGRQRGGVAQASTGHRRSVERVRESRRRAAFTSSKDRFTRPEHFRAMEPRLPRFFALRDKWDPKRRLRSAQSKRLFGDEA